MSAPLSASSEASAVSGLHSLTLSEGSIWSVIDAKWIRSWSDYTGFDFNTGKAGERKTDVRPVRIDNTRLKIAESKEDKTSNELTASNPPPSSPSSQSLSTSSSSASAPSSPPLLRKGIDENLDFILVPSAVADLLYVWYGSVDHLRFDRTVMSVGIRKTMKLDLYPAFVDFWEVQNDGNEVKREGEERGGRYGSKETFEEIRQALEKKEKEIENKPATNEETKEGTEKDEATIRLWIDSEALPSESNTNSTTNSTVSTHSTTSAIEPSSSSSSASTTVANGVDHSDDERMSDCPTAQAAADSSSSSSSSSSPSPSSSSTSPSPPSASSSSVKWRLLSADELVCPLESFNFNRSVRVLVDKKEEAKWRKVAPVKEWNDFQVGDQIDCLDTVLKWYQSTVADVKSDSVKIHFNGWNNSWDEWIPRNSDRLAPLASHSSVPRSNSSSSSSSSSYSSYSSYSSGWSYNSNENGTPSPSGTVGLRNLGNTCFMNSILSSLFHCPKLTDYFLENRYLGEINRDNPLGWGGKIADEWGSLVKDYWSNKYTVVAPRNFKQVLGEFQPRFSGYQQQDSNELLLFLLDALHEDLNRIAKKPATATVESNNRPDELVADEAWHVFQLRNKSVMVDHLYGQLKSRVTCPIASCGKVSITFDPFNCLQVPLPQINDTVQILHVMFADPSRPITIFAPLVSKVCKMSELKEALSKLSGIPSRRMVIGDVWNKRVCRFLDDDSSLSDIRPPDVIFVFEVPQLDHYKAHQVRYIQIVHSRLETNKYWDPKSSYSREFSSELFGIPRIMVLPKETNLPCNRIRADIEEFLTFYKKPDCPAVGAYKILCADTDGRSCASCPYDRQCFGCELPQTDEEYQVKTNAYSYDKEARLAFAVQWQDNGAGFDADKVDKLATDESAKDKTGGEGVKIKEESVGLGDCIQAFTREETLGENDFYYCSNCKEFRQATKQMELWKAPEICIFNLKRFSYTKLWRDKITTFVDFPLEGLDLTDHILQKPDGESESDRQIYDLFAVSNHYGGLGGGHYTAFCRNLLTGEWFCHDDSRVSPASIDQVRSSAAYVLFYAKRGSWGEQKIRNSTTHETAQMVRERTHEQNGRAMDGHEDRSENEVLV